jgi:LPXTG-motif cell wall-anchored protein
MQINRLARFAAAAALGASVGFAAASPAMADSHISINPGNVPTTAQDAEQSCDPNFGGGPYVDKDVWVFNLPNMSGDAGEFLSVTANFEYDTNGDGVADATAQVVIDKGAADGDDIVLNGTSKAYAITPAGWTLVSATAEITGTADFFVLTHACAGGTSESSSPPPSTPTTPPSSPSTPTSSAPGGGGGNGGGENGGGLPITGVAASSIAVVGAGLIGTGAVLLLRRRRKFVA